MAAAHFTTIPFEPNMADYTLSHIFFFGGVGGGGGGGLCTGIKHGNKGGFIDR